MKNPISWNMKYVAAGALALFVTSCSNPEPSNLRVDYIRVPELASVVSQNPIFSWQIPQESRAQGAYQIIVSSNGVQMWDSGKVESDNAVSVVYDGAQLLSDSLYQWRVRYWDTRDRKSHYSALQTFVMAPDTVRDSTIVTNNPLLQRLDRAQSSKKVGDDDYLFDFGRAAFGKVILDFGVTSDTTITVRLGEQLDSLGRIERKPKGSIRYAEVEVALGKDTTLYNVRLKPNKRNTGPRAIPVPQEWGGVVAPFRYLEVCGLGDNDIDSLRPFREVMAGYTESLGAFESSNPVLDSVWDICRYTIQATDFLGYYIDGDRERIPYEADAYINQLGHYCVDSEYAIAKKSLEYFIDHATWPTEWLLHTIMMAHQDYLYTGDTRLIAEYYDKLKAKTLYQLGREDGLIDAQSEAATPEFLAYIGFEEGSKRMTDIVDWPPAAFKEGAQDEIGERDGHEMMPINTVVNAFHAHALGLMSEMAAAVGKDDDSKMFADLSAKVKESLNAKLFDKTKGIYIDGEGSTHSSLHSNMVPLAFGLVDKENVQSVVDFVKSRGMMCSVYGSQYMLEALYNAGEAQYALDLMTNKTDRGWYNMIAVGSTMTLEAWDIKYKGNLDWNHAWGAPPANIIPRKMWGVTPTAVGYKSAMIKPQMADLEHSSITVPTLQGVIRCSYTRDASAKSYTIVVPANMTAIFESVDEFKGITLNGDKLEGTTFELTSGENTVVVNI